MRSLRTGRIVKLESARKWQQDMASQDTEGARRGRTQPATVYCTGRRKTILSCKVPRLQKFQDFSEQGACYALPPLASSGRASVCSYAFFTRDNFLRPLTYRALLLAGVQLNKIDVVSKDVFIRRHACFFMGHPM